MLSAFLQKGSFRAAAALAFRRRRSNLLFELGMAAQRASAAIDHVGSEVGAHQAAG